MLFDTKIGSWTMDGYKLNAALFVDGETEQVGINSKWFVRRWALKPVKFRFNFCPRLTKNICGGGVAFILWCVFVKIQ